MYKQPARNKRIVGQAIKEELGDVLSSTFTAANFGGIPE
jgi:hypothetical protein